METVDANSSTLAEAATLLGHIDQIVRWLPKAEPPRHDLLSALTHLERHLAHDALPRAEILNLQVHVLRLKGSPLKTLLNRRVAELDELSISGRRLL